MPPPLVTIVMPVYNGSNYLRAAIDSALAQDYPNLEILVVNDGSRDEGATEAIALSYGERIRYVAKPNGGVATALNRGIEEMRGEIFCWLSHDDIHLPHKTSRQVAEWERGGRRDEVLISDYRLIGVQGEPLHDVVLNHALIEEKPLYALLRGSIHGCTVFLPKRILDDVGNFDPSLPTTQDYDLWNRMIRRYRFRHMPEILIGSRQHDEQGSKKMDHRVEARALWNRMVRDVPLAEKERLEGSEYRFIGATAKFLTVCGLPDVAEDLVADAGAALAAILVSVVILPSPEAGRMLTSLDSALAQAHPALEILVMDPGDAAATAAVERRIADHPGRARLIPGDLADGPAAWEAGCRAAAGRYLIGLHPGDLLQPGMVGALLLAMENAGAERGAVGGWWRRPGASLEAVAPGEMLPPDGAAPQLSGAMFRRDGSSPLDPAAPDLRTVLAEERLVVLRPLTAQALPPPPVPAVPPVAADAMPGADEPFSASHLMGLV